MAGRLQERRRTHKSSARSQYRKRRRLRVIAPGPVRGHWLKRTIAALVVLALVVGAIYVRAFFSLDFSTFSRALARGIDAGSDLYFKEEGSGYASGLPSDVAIPGGLR